MTPKKPDARGFTDEMLQNTEKYLETCVQPQVTMDSDSFRGLLARLQFEDRKKRCKCGSCGSCYDELDARSES